MTMKSIGNALELNEIRFEFNLKGKIIAVTYMPTGKKPSQWYVTIEMVGSWTLDEGVYDVHTIAQKVARGHVQSFFRKLHK